MGYLVYPRAADFLPPDLRLPQMFKASPVGLGVRRRHRGRRNLPQCCAGTEDPAQDPGVLLQRNVFSHAGGDFKALYSASGDRPYAV